MCVYMFEPVLKSKYYVRSWLNIGPVVCLHTCVIEYALNERTYMPLGGIILRRYLWRSLWSLRLLACQMIVIVGDSGPRSGELRTRKIKSHLLRSQSLKILPLKPGVSLCIKAIHATLTARNFVLTNFYPTGPVACIFFQTSVELYLC